MSGSVRIGSIAMLVAVTLAAAVLAGCSSGPAATPASAKAAPTKSAPSELPTSCALTTSLAPVSPTPTWPTGAQILDAVPNALASQYPTVFGEVVVAPATAGESAVEINSHLVVLETVHDPSLEAEVRAAYPSGITVTFEVTSRSSSCLGDLNARVTAQWNAAAKSGITIYGVGIDKNQVLVSVSACTPSTEQAAKKWFSQRWGDAVSVATCQLPAKADVG
ncbi:MAG: hypothetical protein ACLQOZ_11110 [Acidimicrobiales bacterium]